MNSAVVTVARSPVMISVITTLQPDNQPGNQTAQTNDKTNRRPVPMIEVHRCSEGDPANAKIEVRQALVDRFGHPHIVSLLIIAGR